MLIREAIDAFLTSRNGMGATKNTLETYRRELPLLMNGPIHAAGVRDVAELKTEHLQQVMSFARERGISPNTLKSYRIRLAAFINYCGEMGYCQKGLMEGVGRVRGAQYVRRVYTEDEVRALIEFARLRTNPFSAALDVAIIMTLIDTGMRISELTGLKIEDLSDGGVIRVRGKGNKDRFVAASPATLAAIHHYLKIRGPERASAPLFLNFDGLPSTQHGIYLRFRRMGVRIGIHVNPHKFRHSMAKMALENGGRIICPRSKNTYEMKNAMKVYVM